MNVDLDGENFKDLLKEYYKAKFLHDLQAKAVHSFLPNDIEDLELKEKKLNIITKKKNLGIPLNDDDYELAVNEDKPFLQKNAGLMAIGLGFFGKKLTNNLPDLKYFNKPKKLNFFGKKI